MEPDKLKTTVVFLTTILLVVGLIMMVGCGGEREEGDRVDDTENGEVQREDEEEADGEGDLTKLFLIQEGERVEVERGVAERGPQAALQELFEGPSTEESEEGFSTAIPEGTVLLGYEEVEENGKRVAVVDCSEEILSYGGGSAYVEAIEAQITETVLANSPSVDVVKILVAGVPAEEVLQP